MVIIGIESTAHTFGIGIVKDGKILSNVKDTYTTKKGGIIPIEAAKNHNKIAQRIYEQTLKDAKIKESEIKGIAFSQGPGLAPCLLEGMRFAKKLGSRLKKPLIPVNHCLAHLEIGITTGSKDPVMLYVSGANTQVIAYSGGRYRIFGETLDIGVGNFIDNFARYLGLGFPGGPKIQELAKQGVKYIELPYKVKGMDIALSGILTNLKQKVENIKFYSPKSHNKLTTYSCSQISKETYNKKQKKDISLINSKQREINYTKKDLAYSMQETVFAMLVEIAERALAHTGKKELLLGGGVACNKRLQDMCKIMCKERGCKFFVPDNSLLVDNGTMIAFLGEIMFNKKIYEKNLNKIDIKPRQRTDEVKVEWK